VSLIPPVKVRKLRETLHAQSEERAPFCRGSVYVVYRVVEIRLSGLVGAPGEQSPARPGPFSTIFQVIPSKPWLNKTSSVDGHDAGSGLGCAPARQESRQGVGSGAVRKRRVSAAVQKALARGVGGRYKGVAANGTEQRTFIGGGWALDERFSPTVFYPLCPASRSLAGQPAWDGGA
jgi:hypothetical protein